MKSDMKFKTYVLGYTSFNFEITFFCRFYHRLDFHNLPFILYIIVICGKGDISNCLGCQILEFHYWVWRAEPPNPTKSTSDAFDFM
jgi:hypothetical protein